ncbi:MAG TPA: rhomboid family intramembrane serine protease [Solirubrobacterales bacterium]|nr:rhomboid family intramembrane serine protease [Solirubrobacterales bacterium]
MTPTPVGMRCPECARQKTKVTRGAVGAGRYDAPATYALIAINVAAFLVEIATGSGGFGRATGPVIEDFALQGVAVADGEWYRLLTGGFLHASLFHIGFNMFALYILGRMLEPGIGTPRFVALYFASLFAGSFGALLLSDPVAVTVGASGAVFGLFGAAFLIARRRGLDAIASQLGFLLAINLALTFVLPRLSVGGHLGGLAGGLLCAAIIVAGERGQLGRNRLPLEIAAMTAVAVAAILGALAVA